MKDICCVTPKKGSLTNEQVALQHLEFLFFISLSFVVCYHFPCFQSFVVLLPRNLEG